MRGKPLQGRIQDRGGAQASCVAARNSILVPLAMAAILVFAVGQSHAAWNSIAGVKDGSETVAELQNPWDGERLLAFGGTLNFAGSVTLDGELWLQPMNGWATPVVIIPGTLTMSAPGSQFTVTGGASLNIGNAAESVVEAGNVLVGFDADVSVGELIAHGSIEIIRPGTVLHVQGNFSHTGERFVVHQDAVFQVDGIFTKTGFGSFEAYGQDKFLLANPAASTLEAGGIRVGFGADVSFGEVTAHDDVVIFRPDTLFRVLGDYAQDGGELRVIEDAVFQVGGVFTKTGDGRFEVNGQNKFLLANPSASYVEAGLVFVGHGINASIGNMDVHDHALIEHLGTTLAVVNRYTQDAGDLRVIGKASFSASGSFSHSGAGTVFVHDGSFTSGVTEFRSASIALAAKAITGDLTAHDSLTVEHTATSLQVSGSYTQLAGNLFVIDNATMSVDGAVSYTAGNTIEVRNNATLASAGTGASTANFVNVHSGGQATLGSLAAHGTVNVDGPTSVLRIGGDYHQDAGGLAIANSATLNVDGSFRYAVGGPRLVNFGNGLLRVGDTLTLDDGHLWNLAGSGGRVRVGAGLTAPAAGTVHIAAGGTLAGHGGILGSVANAAGTIAPGLSAGRLDVTSNYVQGAAANLWIEIGGTVPDLQYDQLFVSGAATLSGKLTVDLIDLGSGLFAPSVGQTFEILKAGGGRTGTFATLDLPSLGAGRAWEVNYLANGVQLAVVAAATLPGDFNLDGSVDGADFLRWQRGQSPHSLGTADWAAWVTSFGQPLAVSAGAPVPEPAGWTLAAMTLAGCAMRRARSR